MYIEKIPLQERLERLRDGICAHWEYYAAEIHRFGRLPVATYFRGMTDNLAALERLAGISHADIQNMTYIRLAHAIDGKLHNASADDNKKLYEVIEHLAAPMVRVYNAQPEQEEQDSPPPAWRPQHIPLDKRLENNTSLENCVLPGMDVESFLMFMDDMVLPGWQNFSTDFAEHFQQLGEQTIVSLIAESMQMPEAQREKILYHLLIKPFAYLEEHPAQRYKP